MIFIFIVLFINFPVGNIIKYLWLAIKNEMNVFITADCIKDINSGS